MSERDSTKLLSVWLILSVLLCVCVKLSSSQVASGDHSEASALLKWKASLDKQSQATLSSWKNGTSPCRNWKGISCDESMAVSVVNLTSIGLQGKLQTLSFSSFPNLTHFDISNNLFYGIIPTQIANLSSILTLNMAGNPLTGPIPREIGALSTLKHLDIGVCNLSGSIPQEIGNLRNLIDLTLETNHLSGFIPQEIGMLSNLVQLDLSENAPLTGRIPSTIGNLSKLALLYLYNNSLIGPIPDELGKLYSLSTAQLDGNNLFGPIPPSIGNLTKLEDLKLSKNKLSGPIPASIGNLVNLKQLGLFQNSLSGTIPSTIGNLTKLTVLQLLTNKLSGSLPPQLDNLTNLENLQLGENDFTGHLPHHVCLGGSLERLSASPDNRFTGPIPRTLRNCTSLIRLRLDGNQLVGNISEDFGVYPNLKYIDLSGNLLYGQLSPKWGKCGNLASLKISNNNITGGIPPELGEAINLGELDLSWNHLKGQIPKELGKLTSMNTLYLSHNQFSGKVPREIGSLNQLEILDLAANNFSGSIMKVLGGLEKLRILNWSKNTFGESIPSELGKLQALERLDLSENLLSGTIPTELGDLARLVILNLSHNHLFGSIPSRFDQMEALTYVDISSNQLEGSLPNNPAFLNLTHEALRNNKGLCGNVSGLDPCNRFSENQNGYKSKKVKFFISFLTLGTLIMVVAGVSYAFYRSSRKTKMEDEEAKTQHLYFVWSSDREIMYKNIIEATKYFDDRYLIGKGGQGSVYKAELPTGQVVAVKKLHSMPNGEISNRKALTSEVQALTEIKHRNVVKLYGFLANSEFSILVYEFMEGGSLDNVLKNGKQAIELDWNKRVNIVKGVANALFYMHHGCSIPIVHRDISSKNVLLDLEHQEARLTDFGTAKFLKPNSENMTTFAGTFGYAAPEIAYIMEANEKCDVYSFGVLTLEIIMGMHPGELIASLRETLTTYDLPVKDLLDQRLPQPKISIIKEVMLIAKIAFACLNENPRFRPTMEQVSMELVTPKFPLVNQFATVTIRQLMRD